jgi:hypothetical protein
MISLLTTRLYFYYRKLTLLTFSKHAKPLFQYYRKYKFQKIDNNHIYQSHMLSFSKR